MSLPPSLDFFPADAFDDLPEEPELAFLTLVEVGEARRAQLIDRDGKAFNLFWRGASPTLSWRSPTN